MNKLLTTVVALTALAVGPAIAADIPVKAPVVKAPPPVVFSWTGFYSGVFVGGAWADKDVTTTDPCLLGAVCPTVGGYNGVLPAVYDLRASVIAGVTSGYNWQSGQWVFGLETETGYIRLRRTANFFNAAGVAVVGGDTTAQTRIGDWYSVFAARLGVAAWERTLLYAKGGAVYTRVRNGVVDTCVLAPCGPATINTTDRENVWGWTAGGGIEYAFSQNWSAKAEYLFLGIQDDHTHCGVVGPGAGPTFCSISKDPGVHTVKGAIIYHWGGPVIARY